VKELSTARKRRLFFFSAGGTLFACALYVLIHFLKKPVGQSLGETLIIGAASSVIGNIVGFLVAKFTDNFPRSAGAAAQRYSATLKQQLYEISDAKRSAHQEIKISDTDIRARLAQLVSRRLSQLLEEDDKSYASAALHEMNTVREEIDGVRNAYLSLIASLAQVATKTLGQPQQAVMELEEVATEIRNKEISPSFAVLDETRAKYEMVKQRLLDIKFS
jgi:hypothetical protein